MKITDIISSEMNLTHDSVLAVVELLNHGDTIPFMARYRKEVTGSLDEVVIAGIRDRMEQLKALDNRKDAIVRSLKERKLLTEALLASIGKAQSMSELEDIYEKYRPKKRTRAQIARQKGLESLADFLLNQSSIDPFVEAVKYISLDREVQSAEDALSGARDIIAEIVNEQEIIFKDGLYSI